MHFNENITKYLLDCHISASRKFVSKDCERLKFDKLPIDPMDDIYTSYLLLMFKAEANKEAGVGGLICADCFVVGSGNKSAGLQPLYFSDVDFTKTEAGFNLSIGEKTLNVDLLSDLVKDDKMLEYVVDNDMSEADVIRLLNLEINRHNELILVKTAEKNCVENELRKMAETVEIVR